MAAALLSLGCDAPSPVASHARTDTARRAEPMASADSGGHGQPASALAPVQPVRMSWSFQQAASARIRQAIDRHRLPGCVLVVGDSGGAAFRMAFGHRALRPRRERMTIDTIFDLASLTKPLVTATSVLQLVEAGKLGVDTLATDVWPAFAVRGGTSMTVEHLLTHSSGLPAITPRSEYENDRAKVIESLLI